MKITVNAKYTSRVLDALAESTGDSYLPYADDPSKTKEKQTLNGYGHAIGNTWCKTAKKVGEEWISLIEMGVFESFNIEVLKSATYSDGFPCFTIN